MRDIHSVLEKKKVRESKSFSEISTLCLPQLRSWDPMIGRAGILRMSMLR